eukprot:6348561-Pyramimonas_sp.AAC.1
MYNADKYAVSLYALHGHVQVDSVRRTKDSKAGSGAFTQWVLSASAHEPVAGTASKDTGSA